ncbi:MAG: PAS domain S-box protein [Chthoniobacterales bacterium]|nr:PAS domain S-box protein [Chthoniobacterales bacterium]
MNAPLAELADYIAGHVDWITEAWVGAIERQPDIHSADDLTHRQVVDHLPSLCHDLADRLRSSGTATTFSETEHARAHGIHRWEQGYRLDELIREAGIIRHVFAVECVDAFAQGVPEFDARARSEAETAIHRFFDDMLIASARQFAGEQQKALGSSEQNTAAILQSALDSIVVIGEDGRVIEWNPAAEQMFGFERTDAVGKELAELIIPPEFREQHHRGMAHYLATGEGPLLGRRVEVPALRADGTSILVELAITPYRVDGKAVFTAYLRDITQRLAGEQALQRLAAVVESSNDAIISKDLDGSITSWNEGASRIFGYTAQEIIGKPITTLIPEERRSEEVDIIGKIRQGEQAAHYETVRRRKDGSLINVSLTVSPIKDHNGSVVGASKIARDISERVQHEKRREAQYAIATLTSGEDSLPETAPKILETIGNISEWIFGALWLRQPDDSLTCHTTWQRPGSDVGEFDRATRLRVLASGEGIPGKVIQSGKPAWIPDVVVDSNFTRREVAAFNGLHGALLFPLTSPGGSNGAIELLGSSIASPDPDLLRLVEALGIQVGLYIERKHTEDELHRQKDAAEAANQAKDRFLAALSHELRTPLTPVLMWACATAADETLDPELREDIRMVCRNVELEARLIDDLLDLTRITQGKLQLKLQTCDVHLLFEHALEIVRSQVTLKNQTLFADLKATNHQIVGDATRIQQVFWNLLKNAQKFTPETGRISVRSYDAAPGAVGFEVSDTGRGIDPELMPKLFTAFQQGGSSTEGLGLGLAICKAIVEMHGGKISARSDGVGAGATFTVELSTVAGQGLEGSGRSKPTAHPWRKLRILMVEDHEHTALVMSRLLRRAGHEVVAANNVQSAIHTLRFTKFDLLVSDLGLPDGNGFQVMRELARRSDAKGIAVSGYGMDEDVAQSSAAGFSAHLTKPISPEQLTQTIQDVTGA